MREAVVDWRFYPAVLGLQTMRGVQFTTAVGMLSELGDLSRFEHPRQLMAWLGVTPSEHSSGDKRRQGSITKTGNSYARKLLVEAAWSYRYPARVSPDIQRRHEGIPKRHHRSRLGRTGPTVPPISQAGSTRQEREHRCRRRRPRTGRVHLGHQPAGNVARRTAQRTASVASILRPLTKQLSERSFLKAA